MRAALNQAVDDGIILSNPSRKVKAPRVKENKRVYLTKEEVLLLFKEECRYDVLKRAFLFSCLTGLRWADVQNLEWSDLTKDGDNWIINFHQKKTKGLQYHPVPEDARKLMGDMTESLGRVFVGLRYSAYMNVALNRWMLKAGITKPITFHCARHTYATLLLTNGTDLYTVSKMLGHKEIKTTEIYANIIDSKKMEAANSLDLFSSKEN